MATLYGHDMHYDSMAPKEDTVHADDIKRIKKELDLLKDAVCILSIQKLNTTLIADLSLEPLSHG